jgi:hypothetical protein
LHKIIYHRSFVRLGKSGFSLSESWLRRRDNPQGVLALGAMKITIEEKQVSE